MNFQLSTPRLIERRLLALEAGILFVFSISLTISPAVRERSWDVPLRWNHWVGFLFWLSTIILVHWQLRNRLPDTDPFIFPIAAFLSGLGIYLIWRLVPSFGFRQSLWFFIGGLALLLGVRYSSKVYLLRRYKYLLLTSGILLTALTLILGTNPLGAGPRLWLGCCGIYLQPSEPLKLLLVIYLSAYFADNLPLRQGFFPLILPTILLTGIAILILIVQRDLGTASIFIFLYAVILYLATGRKRVILVSFLILVVAGIVGYYAVDIIQIRLIAWLNPWSDPGGAGYQTIQSLLAISNGGVPGRGIGVGYPALVPVAISDFIFSASAEEMGLVGTIFILSLIAVMISRGIRSALFAQDTFKRLMAAGLAAYLGAQSILIIGGNLRLLPLTGVTLPFVSYGGSSLMTSLVAVMLILVVASQPEEDPAPLQNPSPYIHLAALFFLLIFGLAMTNGWWSIWRADDILSRTDNLRRSISDVYVPRGNLVDRSLNPINITLGESGTYTRKYLYPELSSVTGYINSTYGQSGLELSTDSYLRGTQGNPSLSLWWNRFLYGTPPPGLSVRLSLDLSLQSVVDELLGSHKGSAVLINARTGEILAMASHPTFDANTLSEKGDELLRDPDAPLLNRAAQGAYNPGLVLAFFTQLKDINAAQSITKDDLVNYFSSLGFYTSPDIGLPVADASPYGSINGLKISPLQAAVAATVLANGGLRQTGQIVSAVQTPSGNWVVLQDKDESLQVVGAESVMQFTNKYLVPNQSYWRLVSSEGGSEEAPSWFIGGTPTGWQGTPLIAVVALEEGSPVAADFIGQEILQAALER